MEEDAVAESDFKLASRVACGEPEAVRDVIERHGGRVWGYLRVKFPSVAEDAFQEAMAKLLEHADQFDPAKSKNGLGPWLVSIAHNCACDLLAATPDERPVLLHEGVSRDRRWPTRTTGDAKSDKRRKRLIREAMKVLSPREREVMEADLAYFNDSRSEKNGVPAADLAHRLGTSQMMVYKARSTGRSKLGEELERVGAYQSEGQP
jgi:RNA polymerase sigma factor (sigma-70 family)